MSMRQICELYDWNKVKIGFSYEVYIYCLVYYYLSYIRAIIVGNVWNFLLFASWGPSWDHGSTRKRDNADDVVTLKLAAPRFPSSMCYIMLPINLLI